MPVRKVDIELPTKYANGTPLDPSKVVTHIYADGAEVGKSGPGETVWTGEVAQEPGQSVVFTGRWEIDGVEDEYSVPSEGVVFALPLPVAGTGRIISVS